MRRGLWAGLITLVIAVGGVEAAPSGGQPPAKAEPAKKTKKKKDKKKKEKREKKGDRGASTGSAEGDRFQASIAKLEAVYQAHEMPDLLLNVAALYESWDGHCRDALEAYRRFFTQCTGCPSLSYGTERFDQAIERCIEDPEEEIAIRKKYIVPVGQKPMRKTADATRSEVVGLLQAADAIDRSASGMLFVALAETRPEHVQTLNELREKAWRILQREDATSEQVFKILQRLKRVDHAQYQALLARLVKAELNRDVGAMNAVRTDAFESIKSRSTGQSSPSSSRLTGCHPNLEREWGFLTVNTSPWSTVYVNGQKRGGTPVHKVEVLAGCATVRALDPVTGKQVVKNVTIRPNLTAILQFDLVGGTESLRYD